MEFNSVVGREFQAEVDAFLKTRFNMFFVVCCCLRSGAVEERSILVYEFCWMRLHKYAGVEVERDLKVYNAVLKMILDCEGYEVE